MLDKRETEYEIKMNNVYFHVETSALLLFELIVYNHAVCHTLISGQTDKVCHNILYACQYILFVLVSLCF